MGVDVLVVGAGPAGSVTALELARAGVSVRVVDRARFPRGKLCGDTVNPGTIALLDRLGAGDAVRAASRPVRGMLVSGPGSTSLTAGYPAGLAGAALRRATLDQILLDSAVRAGACFDEGVQVDAPLVDSNGRVSGVRLRGSADRRGCDVRAGLVIAADGRGSRLASALGLAHWSTPKRWAFGAYFRDVAGTSSWGEMHVRADGYIGIAPLPDGSANVCVVRDLTQPARAGRMAADRVIRATVERDPMLVERFAGATQISDVAVLGPLAFESRSAGVAGLLLAGDAAGFIDPMTGDGLRFAIRGGELAAHAALHELESGQPAHEILAAARRAEFAGKSRFNRAVRWLTGSRRGLSAAALLASWWAMPFEPLVRVAGDCALARRLTPG